MRKVSFVTIISTALLISSSLYAEDYAVPEKINLGAYYNNEEITATKQVNGENTTYTYTGNNGFSASTQNGININALQLLLGVTANAESNFTKMKADSNWHKVVSHYRSGTNDDYTVTTLASVDSVVSYITSVKDPDFCRMKRFTTKNPELIREVTGSQSIIGMTREEVGKYFGSTHEYSYCLDYCVRIPSNNDEYTYVSIIFNDDSKVKEVAVKRQPESKLKIFTYMEGGNNYYSELPEGWYSMGQMTGTGVNIRKEPKTGEVIGNTGWKHPYVYFNETRDTGEDFKWLKIRAKVIDEKTKEYKGIEGWVYGRYVSPSDKTYSMNESVYASIAVMDEMPHFLGISNAKASTIEESVCNEEGEAATYTQSVLTWPEGLTCVYNESNPSAITAKPVEDDMEQRPVTFTITSDKLPFLGLKVGMGLDEVKKINDLMIKAGWGVSIDESQLENGTVFWNCDMQQIQVNIKGGKVESISHESLPAY